MSEIKIDKIIRSRRKTIALIISSNKKLLVRAPFKVKLSYIKKLVFAKRNWIERKKQEIGDLVPEKKFITGEKFLFLNKSYELKIEQVKEITLTNYLIFPKKYLKNPREKMIKWYQKKALGKIKERVIFYSQKTGWQYTNIKITSAEKRWGSCSPNKSLNFSWRLIMAPLNIIDYVVIHELVHTRKRNHSKEFWQEIESILPDYKTRQEWLRENSKFLKI